VPGTILAARYRIVGLLGKGGMGEVYRADDLKLSQPVSARDMPPRARTCDQAVKSLLLRRLRNFHALVVQLAGQSSVRMRSPKAI